MGSRLSLGTIIRRNSRQAVYARLQRAALRQLQTDRRKAAEQPKTALKRCSKRWRLGVFQIRLHNLEWKDKKGALSPCGIWARAREGRDWILTHRPTGKRGHSRPSSARAVEALARAYLALPDTDWTLSDEKALAPTLARAKATYRAFQEGKPV